MSKDGVFPAKGIETPIFVVGASASKGLNIADKQAFSEARLQKIAALKDVLSAFKAEDMPVQAVRADTAFLMTSMLQEVIDGGTAWKARQLGFRLPAGLLLTLGLRFETSGKFIA